MDWNLGLNFYSVEPIIFEPNELNSNDLKEYIKKNKYHIYILCKRKKLYFESCNVDKNCNVATFYTLNEKHEKIRIGVPFPKNIFVNSLTNGIYDFTVDNEKKELRDFEFVNLLLFQQDDLIGNKLQEPLISDLEVLYIGQAFGRSSIKTIDYRVSNHEKVQQIALEIIRSGSNEELLVIGLKIKTNDIGTSFVTPKTKIERVTTSSLNEIVNKAKKRLTVGQEVTVFEASLIKYFQSSLNKEYKETFPSKDFPSYEELMNTDFDYSAMAIDTRPIGVRLYSNVVNERLYVHTNHYPLKTQTDKLSLFDFLYELNDKQSS